MQHTPTSTADGSSTLQLTQFGETYHSRNGAYTEAMHIYIKNGLEHLFESVANRSYAATNGSDAAANGSYTATNRSDAAANGSYAATNRSDAATNGNDAAANGNDAAANGSYAAANRSNTAANKSDAAANGSYATFADTPASGNTAGPGWSPVCLNIFDVGLGTGLNCILTWAWQQQLRQAGLPYPRITYYGIEKYPIHISEIEQFNYPTIIAQHTDFPPDKLTEIFHLMHSCPWEKDVVLPNFTVAGRSSTLSSQKSGSTGGDFILHKTCADITELGEEYYWEAGRHSWSGNTERHSLGGDTEKLPENADKTGTAEHSGKGDAGIPAVVYYDTFSPATQPNLWDETIFRNIASGCTPGSLLVTYCSKGTVKQALRSAGFTLERLSGPPGKRHILRGRL